MRQLLSYVIGIIIALTGFFVVAPLPVQAQVSEQTCQPFDVTFVMDDSGSMDDHDSDKVLKKRLLPRLQNMFSQTTGTTAVSRPINGRLVTFSYENGTTRTPVNYDEANSADESMRRINTMGFGADGSNINSGIRTASDGARARYDSTNRLQVIVVAGDEQTSGISNATETRLAADKLYKPASSGRTFVTQPAGIRYYTFALHNAKTESHTTYAKIASTSGGRFYPKTDSAAGSDGIGYEQFRQEFYADICSQFRMSINGYLYNSAATAEAAPIPGPWTVNLYEENAASAIATATTNSSGQYFFNDLRPTKKYRVVPVAQAGWSQTTPDDIYATPHEQQIRNFGFIQPTSNSNCLTFQLTPTNGDYSTGDDFIMRADITNVSARNDKVRLTIPSIPGVTLVTGSVAPFNAATLVSQGSGYQLTSTNEIARNQTWTVYWRYHIEGNATPGPRSLTVGAKLLNCSDTISIQVGFTIFAPANYDLRATITPPSATIRSTDQVIYTLTVQDSGSTVAHGLPTANSIIVPKGLTLQSMAPAGRSWTVTSEDQNRDRITWTDTLPESELISYALTFTAQLNAAGSPYQIEATTLFARPGDHDRDLNHTNNSVNTQLNVMSTTAIKQWDDTKTSEQRLLVPEQQIRFSYKLNNTTGAPINNVYVVDYMTVTCNPAHPATCNGIFSDESVAWANISGSQRLANGGFLMGPQNLSAAGSVTGTITGRVRNAAILAQLITQYGPQTRCNNFALADASGNVIGPPASVCWTYDLPADLTVHKTFLDGTKTKQIKQGDIDGFIITVQNTGQNTAANTKLIDTISQSPVSASDFVAWDDESVEASAGTLITSRKAQWNFGALAPGASKTVRPNFLVVPCDTPTGSVTRQLSNLAVVTTDTRDTNTANNNNNNDVTATIINGHYELALVTSTNRSELVRGEPGNDTAIVTFAVQNLDQPSVNMAVPDVSLKATIPNQFEIVDLGGGQLEDGKLVWSVGSVAKGQTINKTVTLRIKPTASAGTQTVTAEAISVTANGAKTCGYAADDASMSVKLAGLHTIKSLPAGATTELELGKTVTYEAAVVNNSGVTFTNPMTLSDAFATPLSFAQIDTCTLVNDLNGQRSSCPKPQAATSGSTATWPVLNPLPPRSTVIYSLTANSDPNYQPTTCPVAIDNSITLKEGSAVIHQSAPVAISLYASRCFSGNVYTQTQTTDPNAIGVDIRGSDIIVDSNSIISSKNKVQCTLTNASCVNLRYKINGYGVDEQTGSAIAFETLKGRMNRNANRLQRNAETLPAATLTGTFDLQGDKAKFLQGRVWRIAGDLTIQTPLKLTGKGTIIVEGNLRITGNQGIEYCDSAFANCSTESRDGSAVGFIVRNADGARRNASIGADVTKLVGAYYVPNGSLTFEGSPTNSQLRPAKGMFIAESLVMNRQKLVVLYDAYLNTPQGAPPGFTYTASPSETEEGS